MQRDIAPERKHRDAPNWAFVVAPAGDGWLVTYVRDGASLVQGGGWCRTIDEALADIRDLALLMERDALTAQIAAEAVDHSDVKS